MLKEYYNIIIFSICLIAFVCFLLVVSWGIVYQEPYQDKISPYECGFQPFEYSLSFFEVRYYLVALVFLLFDLELIFLLPWAVIGVEQTSQQAVVSFLVFYFFLSLGFYYEWKMGALEWD